MTLEELKQRQSWTLEQKIDHAIGAIEAFISYCKKEGKGVYISFSGGKDSTVLVDMVRRFIDPENKIPVVFCNTGNEYPEIVKFVRDTPHVTIIRPKMKVQDVISKYGFPLISKEQSQYIREAKTTKSKKLLHKRLYGDKDGKFKGKISECWKFLINERFNVSEKCCYHLKKAPFKKYEKSTGRFPIMGIMAEESNLRKSQYVKRGGCNYFKSKRYSSHPISIFTEDDIWDYKDKFDIEFSEIYDHPEIDQTGCACCGFGAHENCDIRFFILNDTHPKMYDQFMDYTNSGITYKEALETVGVVLPVK